MSQRFKIWTAVSESVGSIAAWPVSRAKFKVGHSYRVWRVEALVPPWYRGSGPRPTAAGDTELAGVRGQQEATGADGSGQQRGPLEVWDSHVGSPNSESRVRVVLVRVATGRWRVTHCPRRGELQVKPEPASYPSPSPT